MEDLTRALPGLSLSEQPGTAVDNGVHANDVTKPPTPPAAEGASSQPQHQTPQHAHTPAPLPEYEAVDAAIRQALADPTQRVTVLKCEDLVEKFLADPSVETLQFPASFTSYQRMLAHRVGQYYGLQTSTVDYEESQGRVVAVRTMHCKAPKPRLRDLDVRSDPVAQRTNGVNGLGGQVAEKPRLLRRQDDDRSQQNSSEHSLNQSPARTIKERHEIYMKAREELGLGSGPQDGMVTGRGGRGGPGGRFGTGGRMDGGRGRKAVFRDKDKDLSDPDYRRGMNRFNGTARFDPSFTAIPAGGIYQVPTYASEFPALNRMPSGGPAASGWPHMQQHQQQQAHQLTPGAQSHPMAAHSPHQQQAGPGSGAWGQQQAQQQQGPGVRPPPPPPPPHHHVAGPAGGAGSGSGPNGKAHHQASGGGGGAGGRQQQQAQQQAFGPAMATTAYASVGAQYPVPVAVGAAGFMPAAPGQHMFSMAAGGAIPGAMYTAPAPGVSGAFYPGVGMGAMGMSAMGVAVPTAPAYGYLAPGVGVGVGAQGEAITLAPGGAYPVYASYPAGATMYPAAAAQMPQAAAMHPAAGGAIPMRPMYGVPTFYPGYDPSQYAAGPGMQSQGQGEGRMYGGYGSHQQHHHNHGSGGMGGHGHGGSRTRDSDNGVARGESQGAAAATASGGLNATGNGSAAGAASGDAK
ncbi:hypothetical protein PLESTB_000808500 [Pleodorina starrii]|uniref:Uncharacterized protein n=1 Tax=Pleodorina starrii TaxID=330485 RepID=A0A9W6BL13_9CHLO|nr:hypothetical protein PLESTM_000916200 [Pleodorina starrii]GLC53958.1 hypothetical protein PLESTB_000808500 [Pleodorina starrii]GLC70017.1 hypothetical protein PLESTF_000913700 [Pleodorina starrii]